MINVNNEEKKAGTAATYLLQKKMSQACMEGLRMEDVLRELYILKKQYTILEDKFRKYVKSTPLRGNYRCSLCNLPKRGHKCPYKDANDKKDGKSEENTSKEDECAAGII